MTFPIDIKTYSFHHLVVTWFFQLPKMSSEKAFRGTPNVQNKITHQLRLEDFGWRLMFVDMRLTNHTWMSRLCTFILGFAFVADVSNLFNMGVSLIHHLQSSYLSEIILRFAWEKKIWFQMMVFHGDLAWYKVKHHLKNKQTQEFQIPYE